MYFLCTILGEGVNDYSICVSEADLEPKMTGKVSSHDVMIILYYDTMIVWYHDETKRKCPALFDVPKKSFVSCFFVGGFATPRPPPLLFGSCVGMFGVFGELVGDSLGFLGKFLACWRKLYVFICF